MELHYTIFEYQEAGRWNPFFTGRLWECQYQSSRVDMPWKILDGDGRLVERGDGKAVLCEFNGF